MRHAKEDFRIVGGQPGQRRHSVEFELRGAGRSFPLFFRSDDAVLEAGNEAFLACALLPAMRAGVGLELNGPVSARVLRAVPRIVDIYATWDPTLERFPLPELDPVDRSRAPSGRVATFFSGGVDSFYSLLKHRDEITDLIFVHGFDIPHDEDEWFRQAADGVQKAASELGVGVVRVQTNLRPALRGLKWGYLGHGVALATVGQMLAPVFDRIYIPSTVSYAQLSPWGTHPLLDPLWSTEALEFIHDGCEATRPQKTAFIAESATALRYLRVCFDNVGDAYNCGTCEKCLRTMIHLEAAGRLGQCRTFDKPLDARSIQKLSPAKHNRGYFVESLATLKERGVRPDLRWALARVLWRPKWLSMYRLRRSLKRRVSKLRMSRARRVARTAQR